MKQMTLRILVSLAAIVMSSQPVVVLAEETAKGLAERALQECEQGRSATSREARLAHYQQGQTLAEQAVASDDRSADAHFALFCNLGEQLRLDGESVTSVFGFRRMMSELDRALEVDPSHVDALSAKGTLLVKLPGLLGGDLERGEQLLQQVIKRAPKSVNARLALAKVRCERGHHHEAMMLASDALTIAQKHKRNTFISEAKAVLQQVRSNASGVTTASYSPRF
jgi:hypothetical protein